MHTAKPRKTPWDVTSAAKTAWCMVPFVDTGEGEVSPEIPRLLRKDIVCIHGLYFFDPDRSTSVDFQQFLWAGLRVLQAEAQARSLPEADIRKVLVDAFDLFHDSAESLWAAIKKVASEVPKGGRSQGPAQEPADPFIAFDEDRPVRVQMEYQEPLELLDPDAALWLSPES